MTTRLNLFVIFFVGAIALIANQATVAAETNAPQIHVKARFIEVSQDTLKSIWEAGTVVSETETNTVEIIPSDKFKPLLHQLENAETETLAEPEVTTMSGRQTQMRSAAIQDILTGFGFTTNPAISPTKQFEIGPTIDVVPKVFVDGYTINLTFAVREMVMTVNVWDNQTVVLGNLKDKFVGANAEKNSSVTNKTLLLFVTATLVDPAGNRVHSENELRELEKKNAIPPQN